MPLLTAGPSRFLGGGARLDWWLAGGTIPLANVLEHVENPAARQLYVGASATGAWTIAFRTDLVSVPTANYVFDAQTGRIIIGISTGSNGVYTASAWNVPGLITTGDHSYMVISDGASVIGYRDNVQISASVASTDDISGTVRWRSRHVDVGGWYDWPVEIPRGLVANIALDATQRAALHTSLMA